MASSECNRGSIQERTNTSAPALAGPFYFGRDGECFLRGVTLEMYNEFHHQAPVTERPVALQSRRPSFCNDGPSSYIFLHHVLDEWFEHEVRPRLAGRCTLVRFADDAVMAFEDVL